MVSADPLDRDCMAVRQAAIATALRQATIFRTLDDHGLAALAGLACRRAYQGGALLTEPDPHAPSLFVLASGGVQLVRLSEVGDEAPLLVRRAGDVFEFIARDRDGQPATTARALAGGAVVYTLPRALVIQRLRAYPDALVDIIDLLRAVSVSAFDRVAELALYKLRARLARELLRRADAAGRLTATRCELAAWIAASSEEVIREMRGFQDKGWIAFEPRSPDMTILQPDALLLL
jgi:CRP-like cAMP-binding protein